MKPLRSVFAIRSIRARIASAMLVALLPVVATVVWMLAEDLGHARAHAQAATRILATDAADDLLRFLRRTEGELARIAARPLVRALDPATCDPLVAEFAKIYPDYAALSVRNARGEVVCAGEADPLRRLGLPQMPWFAKALGTDGPHATDATTVPAGTGWMTVLTHPVHDDAGQVIGLLTLPIDLLALGERLLAAVPAQALVAVLDRQRTIILRSRDAARYVGQQPQQPGFEVADGEREGFVLATGVDGVSRLAGYLVLPGLDWRVFAALPESEVFGPLHDTARHVIGVVLVGLLAAAWLGWRLSRGIAGPMAGLAATARRIADGQVQARAQVAGPAEVATVARQLNEMLDARDAAEAALRESEERYRTLVDWSPEALSVHQDGRVLFVNRAAVELLGARSADDLLGHRSIEVIQPEFRAGVEQAVLAATTHDEPIARHEQRFTRADGGVVDVEVQGTRIVYNGQPALIASMRDITRRKQVEAQLQASEARLQAIFSAASDAILTADEAQNVVMANPAAATMFRCEAGSLVGRPVDSLIPARYRARHRRSVAAFGRRAGPAGPMRPAQDVIGLCADGEEFAADASISQVSVGGRQLYTVILRDMTEQRRIEAELRDNEAHLRRLLTLLPEAVCVIAGGQITFVNDAALRLFGTAAEAVLGQPLLPFVHPDSRELVRSRIALPADGAAVAPLAEAKLLRADGVVRVVEATSTLIRARGEDSVLVVMRDVTDLRSAQSALARSHADLQRLFTAQDRVQEAERKRIARELHDDLQQTLAAIRMNLKAAGERLDTDPPGAAALLGEVDALAGTAIESTRRIVNDLRPPILEDLGLVPALEMLAAQFRQHSGIHCRIEAEDDGGIEVESPAVATSLYRVAQESLNNVLKHADAQQVTIRLAATDDDRVLLSIHDDGVGFDPALRRKPSSFGLLGMTERIRALGGELRVDSRRGAGTTIEVRMPLSGDAGAGEGH
jgi:PAS domain S-box-containing protein